MAFLDRFKREVIAENASKEEVIERLSNTGPLIVKRLAKALELDTKGRKMKKVSDISEAIDNGELDLEDVIDMYNIGVFLTNFRVKRSRNAMIAFLSFLPEFDGLESFDDFIDRVKSIVNK